MFIFTVLLCYIYISLCTFVNIHVIYPELDYFNHILFKNSRAELVYLDIDIARDYRTLR